MKKWIVFLIAAVCMVCIFAPVPVKAQKEVQTLGMRSAIFGEFAVALPENFMVVHEAESARSMPYGEEGMGVRTDGNAFVTISYEQDALEDQPDYDSMTDGEFEQMLKEWKAQEYDIRILSADSFWTADGRRLMRYVFRDADRYCINYRYVLDSDLYEMQYSWTIPQDGADGDYEEGLVEADRIGDTMSIGADGWSAAELAAETGRTTDRIAGEPMQQEEKVEIQDGKVLALQESGFSVELPEDYYLIGANGALPQDVAAEQREALQKFIGEQDNGGKPFAVKSDLSVTVSLSCEPGAGEIWHEEGGDGFGIDFDRMTDSEVADMVDAVRDSPRPGYVDMQYVEEYDVAGIRFIRMIYNSMYIRYRTVANGGQEYCMVYVVQNNDDGKKYKDYLPEADAIIDTAVLKQTEITEAATETESVPEASATPQIPDADDVRPIAPQGKQERINWDMLYLCIMLAAVAAVIAVVAMRYAADRNIICGKRKIDPNQALILRLREMESREVLSEEELKWKEEEIRNRG